MSEFMSADPRPVRWQYGRVLYFGEVTSTNTLALEAQEDGLVIVAETQTAGRGRHGKRWASAPGLGLWCSICLQGLPQGLTFAAAVALRAALRPRAPVTLKWPNDLLCEGKKVCGILVEHRSGWNALGFGINVHHRPSDFTRALRETATSLELATGRAWQRAVLLEDVLNELAPRLQSLRRGGCQQVRQEWINALDLQGKRVQRGGVEGHVSGLTDEGALRIHTASGEVVLPPGDVRWLGEG